MVTRLNALFLLQFSKILNTIYLCFYTSDFIKIYTVENVKKKKIINQIINDFTVQTNTNMNTELHV